MEASMAVLRDVHLATKTVAALGSSWDGSKVETTADGRVQLWAVLMTAESVRMWAVPMAVQTETTTVAMTVALRPSVDWSVDALNVSKGDSSVAQRGIPSVDSKAAWRADRTVGLLVDRRVVPMAASMVHTLEMPVPVVTARVEPWVGSGVVQRAD